jgi:hypothetical protein
MVLEIVFPSGHGATNRPCASPVSTYKRGTRATPSPGTLYEAELSDPCLVGLELDTSPRNIAKVVTRAVDVFLAAYGNTGDD